MPEPVTVEIPVRYRDLDTFSHVNNAVYATYVEEARAAYFDHVLSIPVEEYSYVTASLTIDFRRPVHMTDVVAASAHVTDVGTTSVTMAYELAVDGELVATAETTLVWVDMDSREPDSIPAGIRAAIVEHEGLA